MDYFDYVCKGYPKSLKITFASLHFAKVSDFGKVQKPDNQLLLEYVMYGRFANAPIPTTFCKRFSNQINTKQYEHTEII